MGWKLWRRYQNGGLDQEGREQAFVSARYELHRASSIDKVCTCTIDRSINGTVFWLPMVIRAGLQQRSSGSFSYLFEGSGEMKGRLSDESIKS
jgi:hypothetical protein